MLEMAGLLDDHRAEETVVLDVSRVSSWTDYLVISTVRSQAHLKGMLEYINAFLRERSIEVINSRKNPVNQGWLLIDCGFFVINLMDKEKRAFYELEKLWFKAESLYESPESS